ncbi:unnamed protein product, partial [marine sediment metagenome]
YDNPVSADDYRRVLVGCSLLSNPIAMPPHYDFTKDELESWKEKEDMQNFPTINWALQVSHDFEDWGVVLPYQEYVEYVESHPEEEDKLREMRALIEEDALVARFKYVAESLDDDKCTYLLYKLRKSLSIIKEHSIFNVDREQETIERLLSKAWSGRGMYPSLGNIIELMVDHEAAPTGVGEEIVNVLKGKLKEGQDLLDVTFLILGKQSPIPDYLATFADTIHEAVIGFKAHKSLESVLRKLSLFSLTARLHPLYAFAQGFRFARAWFAADNIQGVRENPFNKYLPLALEPGFIKARNSLCEFLRLCLQEGVNPSEVRAMCPFLFNQLFDNPADQLFSI